jgi:hypothetical protein
MTDVLPYERKDTLVVAADAWTLAQKIARTEFVPEALRDKPEATLACMLTGHEVGIGPMQALSKIHVIKGRPGMAAELMRALVLREGHDLWVEESTATRCTLGAKRHNSERETRVTWTMDDAKRANLAGGQTYRQYPRAMLLARATGELCRAVFPDVLAGISYTAEELSDGDFVDVSDIAAAGDVPPPPPPESGAPKTRAKRSIAREAAKPVEPPAAADTGGTDQPPLPGEDEYEGPDQTLGASEPRMTGPQLIAMKCTELGVTDRDKRLALVAEIIGVESLESTKELDTSYVQKVLDRLNEEGYQPDPSYVDRKVVDAKSTPTRGATKPAAGDPSPPAPAAGVNVGLRRRALERAAGRANIDDLEAFSVDTLERPLDEVIADEDIAGTNALLQELEDVRKREKAK